MRTEVRAAVLRACLALLFTVAATIPVLATSVAAQLPDPTLLPVAATTQVPLTAAYDALNVLSLVAGDYYLDPTTGVKIYKLTSATFPTSSPNWGHDYSEGGDEVSLPYNGNTRAVLVRQNGTSGGPWWLIDFTPGVGVSNPRQLTGSLSPWIDLAFTFSNNPATPYYAYASDGSTIRRLDIRTMTEAPGNGWPKSDPSAMWLHQSENDGLFVWMRGASGDTVVGYEPATGTLKTYTNANLNEPRVDRAGRYIGITMNTPQNGLVVWDWNTNSVAWTADGTVPFAHVASLRRRWTGVDWNLSFPDEFSMFTPDAPNSAQHIGGPANSTTIHGNGNWIQHPADLNDQWSVFLHYGSLQPTGSTWLAPGGMILVTPNGERRLLGHPYNTTATYNYYSFAKFSSDGQYVLFTSNMNGSARSDVFLAELPQTDSNPVLSSLSPASILAGAASFVLTANGSNFVSGSTVQWSGANRTTTFVSSTQLQALILDTDVVTPGTAQVTVVNPAPGAGASNSLPFTIGSAVSLVVVRAGSGSGAVTSTPTGITCGTSCSATFVSGTAVTLTATPAAGSTFTGWSGGGCLGAGSCTVALVANTTVIATFNDTTPPTVSLTAPAADSTVAGTVTVSAIASDNIGVGGVQFRLDGANLGTEDTTAPFSIAWNTATAPDGAHTLTAVARDAAGNTTTSAPVTVTVANDLTTAGLVAHWAFDEGSGASAADASGNGHTGSLLNGPTWVAGRLNQALSFDGVDDHVTVAHDTALNAYPLTLAVWLKTNTTSGVRGVVNKYLAGSYNGYQLFVSSGNLCAWYLRDGSNYVYDGGGCTLSTAGANDNQWHHVAFIVDASGGRLYVDGALKASQPWTGTAGAPTTLQSLHVAHYPGAFGGAEYFPGVLDDARIYNRALSAEEILALYSQGTAAPEPVVWTNLVNVAASGNSLQKTAGCDGCPDAGATSQQQITSGDGYFEFTASETTALRFAGLSFGNTDTTGADIDFAIRLQAGYADVRENGVYVADTLFVSGDVFRVAVEAGVVRYYKNGVLFYTSSKTPTYPLLVDAAIYDSGGTITNAVVARGASSPAPDTTAPVASITAPAAGATVQGTITVSASATDDVGVAGVGFTLDGAPLGAEATTAPYAVSWSTATVSNGSHTLQAVARDAAGNTTASAPMTVTVANDVTAPLISGVSASGITASEATIVWATNEASDSQVEYGPTTAYGKATPVDSTLLTAHGQKLTGLSKNTWYHFRVYSRDAAGNRAVSGDYVFKTGKR
ncbi:MAG: hypothetical protein HYV62_13990 [Candidatus Rokubacteria bacterium]|nr:hypothetical protein [Candidatus Rokubacteria bacterium]